MLGAKSSGGSIDEMVSIETSLAISDLTLRQTLEARPIRLSFKQVARAMIIAVALPVEVYLDAKVSSRRRSG